MASQITNLTIVYSIQAQINENINAPRHWLSCGQFTDDAQRESNTESVSIWWRHHDAEYEKRWTGHLK